MLRETQEFSQSRLTRLALAWAGWSTFAAATPLPDASSVPQLPAAGQAEYRQFRDAASHRAFAIAPGGAWGWKADADSAADAGDAALEACRGVTRQTCVLYAVDDRLVFDRRAWSGLWGPYADSAQAKQATVGKERGQRFPDLAFRDGGAKSLSVNALRGKVLVLHFWGSWCKPCRQEMPQLQTLRDSLRDRDDIAFVLLQAREPYVQSRRWAEQQGIRLPLYDSGSGAEDDDRFTLSDGSKIRDRDISLVFPTTYVLDKRGLVVFSHVGPVTDWSEYAGFLRDAARRSGR